jgi:oxygen-independent coproporphyrinogen-3 oxidase
MERIEREGCAVKERETIGLRQSAAEFMFLGLRMVHGILLAEFSHRFGKQPHEFYPEINDWLEEGLIEQEDGRLRLTRRGFLVADSIFLQFV